MLPNGIRTSQNSTLEDKGHKILLDFELQTVGRKRKAKEYAISRILRESECKRKDIQILRPSRRAEKADEHECDDEGNCTWRTRNSFHRLWKKD